MLQTKTRRQLWNATLVAALIGTLALNTAQAECSCLEEHTDNPARLMTESVMQAMVEKYGEEGAVPQPHFDPDQDHGGPYAFSISLGQVEHEMSGITMSQNALLTVGFRHLRSRSDIESNESFMRDLGLEPGEGLLESLARAPMGSFGEPYDARELDGPGELAILHKEPEPMLMIVCGDALMEVVIGRHGLDDQMPEDAPAGASADKTEVMVDLAERLMADCPG